MFLLAGVTVFAALAVLIFEIGPKMRRGRVVAEQAKLTGADVFVPRAANDETPQLLPFEGVPQKAKDGTPLDLAEEPYLYLVKSLAKIDGSALSKDSKRVEYAHYGQVPDQLKGRSVKVTGLFLASNPIRLDKEMNGIEWIYRTYLVKDMRGEEGYVIDLLERPEKVKKNDMVLAHAVFLKLGTYEAKRGQAQAPFFLGKSLKVLPGTSGSEASNAGTLVVGLALGSVLLALYLTSRMWKKPAVKGGPVAAVPVESVKA